MLVKKHKDGWENYFLLNVCVFCREKISKNSGRDGQHLGHLVQPVYYSYWGKSERLL